MEKKEKILKVKLNETQEEILNELIRRTGLTKSEIVRYLLVFQGDIVPTKKEIQKLQRELASIGNNLNQIARAVNKESMTFELFKRVRKEVDELLKVLDSYKK